MLFKQFGGLTEEFVDEVGVGGFLGAVVLGRCFLAGAAGPSAPLRDRFVSESGTRLVSESEPRLVSESEPRLVSGVEPPLWDREVSGRFFASLRMTLQLIL